MKASEKWKVPDPCWLNFKGADASAGRCRARRLIRSSPPVRWVGGAGQGWPGALVLSHPDYSEGSFAALPASSPATLSSSLPSCLLPAGVFCIEIECHPFA